MQNTNQSLAKMQNAFANFLRKRNNQKQDDNFIFSATYSTGKCYINGKGYPCDFAIDILPVDGMPCYAAFTQDKSSCVIVGM